jgi:adenylosuccinate lyase
LTNSAAERVIFPEAFILTDYLLRQLDEILRGLDICEPAIQKNLGLTNGLIMSERIMLELVKRGLGRQEAHEILRQAARTAFAADQSLKEILLRDRRVTKVMTASALDRCLDPASYIGTAVKQVDNLLAALRKRRVE